MHNIPALPSSADRRLDALIDGLRSTRVEEGQERLDRFMVPDKIGAAALLERAAEMLRRNDSRVGEIIGDLGGAHACATTLAAVVVAAIETVYNSAARTS